MARPKRVFNEDEIHKITEMALNNCHMDTIALALDIPKTTLIRRFGAVIKQKRAEGRTILRSNQVKLAKTQAAMAIFLGKNELGQVDKTEVVEKTEPNKELTASQRADLAKIHQKWILESLNRPKQEAG